LAEIVGAVTAGAAGLAAVFAGANLYLSGRRELNKWTRDTLVELFVAFLDASFKHGSACGAMLRTSPSDEQRDALRRAALAAHDLELETLTRLRLLAPPSAVAAAMALLQCEHLLAAPCFLELVTPPDDPETLFEPVRRARGSSGSRKVCPSAPGRLRNWSFRPLDELARFPQCRQPDRGTERRVAPPCFAPIEA